MNLHAQDVPNAATFLPTHAQGDRSTTYANDYSQYAWGKSVRETSRGSQAASDMAWELDDYLSAYSKLIGVNITKNNTPYLYQVLEQLLKYGKMSVEVSQISNNYERPYARFEEESLDPDHESEQASTSSYPSEQATCGWLISMLLVEICPDMQDKIMKRGYEFGESSVISGYNWYSDAQTGRFLASTIMIYIHTMGGFNQLIKMARDEYNAKAGSRAGTRASSYLTYESLPNPVNYLPAPPEDESALFVWDINQYNEGYNRRYGSRGTMAKEDCNSSMKYICQIFSDAFGRTISESETPETYYLISRVRELADQSCTVAKEHYNRKRPYVLFKEETIYSDDEEELSDNGSYPSGHASYGWLIGLTLAEINSANLSQIMKRAYEYGQSRVIAGYHYQTDVDAGRLAAGAAFARLHIEEEFLEHLDAAIKEIKGSPSGIRSNTRTDDDALAPIYTLSGVRLDSEPTQHGVYIQGNTKVVK